VKYIILKRNILLLLLPKILRISDRKIYGNRAETRLSCGVHQGKSSNGQGVSMIEPVWLRKAIEETTAPKPLKETGSAQSGKRSMQS
jgi:hypothetical protein